MLGTQIDKSFLELFHHDIQNHKIEACNATLNLHILKMKNNSFDYYSLVQELFDKIIYFSLSKQEQHEFRNKFGQMFVSATQKLRKAESNEGELGEILLYCLLEAHLEAPKIFTKMEMKTSSNDYVKGADGVHLLKIDEQNFQLIFGESKMDGDLQNGLYRAFHSICDFLNRDTNNINDEISLLCSHLQREAITDEMYKFLKKVIIPSAKDDIYTDNAFGIFVGFDLQLTESQEKLPNAKFRQVIRTEIKQTVEKNLAYIEKRIKAHKLYGHEFYVYCIPFIKIDETRKKMIKCLKGANNDF